MIGAAVVSFPSEAFGRRFVLIVNNVPYLGGAIACALAPNYSVLVIGRFIVGCVLLTHIIVNHLSL